MKALLLSMLLVGCVSKLPSAPVNFHPSNNDCDIAYGHVLSLEVVEYINANERQPFPEQNVDNTIIYLLREYYYQGKTAAFFKLCHETWTPKRVSCMIDAETTKAISLCREQ